MSLTRCSTLKLLAAPIYLRLLPTLLLAWIIGTAVGCREKSAPAPPNAKSPTVASLVPAATDLVVGMGAADHLVAVSNYDTVAEGTRDLPRVGDYLSTDWEMLYRLKPSVMVIQLAPQRVPKGFTDRAAAGRIGLTNLVLDRLSDVYPAIDALGRATGEPAKAAALSNTIRSRLDSVARRVTGKPKVRTLLVLNEDGGSLVGKGNFLNDLLEIAGGDNAAASLGSTWPTADKEKLRALAPEVVLVLDPNPRADALQTARRFWQSIPDVPAARNNQIYLLGDWYVLLNGAHLADIAEAMADHLHPVIAASPVVLP